MTHTHRLAQLVTAAWRLSGESSRIPTSHGLLDRALKQTAEGHAFPKWAEDRLHFVDSRIGLQCVELPSILEWAQRSQLTSAPNPSYETTEIQISDRVARHLLVGLGVTEAEAQSLGFQLRKAISQIEFDSLSVDNSRVEEY